jgi:hypothetical protein
LVEWCNPCKRKGPLGKLFDPFLSEHNSLDIIADTSSILTLDLNEPGRLDEYFETSKTNMVEDVILIVLPVVPRSIKFPRFEHLGLYGFHEGALVGVTVALVEGLADVLLEVLGLFVTNATETGFLFDTLSDLGTDTLEMVLTLT